MWQVIKEGPSPGVLSVSQGWAAGVHLLTFLVCWWGYRRVRKQGPARWVVGVWFVFWGGGVAMHGLATYPGLYGPARWVLVLRDLLIVALPGACYFGISWAVRLLDDKDRLIAKQVRDIARLRAVLNTDPAHHTRGLELALADMETA